MFYSLFEPVHWIFKEKENAEMALEDLNSIKMNGDPSVNRKRKSLREFIKNISGI